MRTQATLHIKLFAAIGVIAAITVTSFSLSQIAWKTFDIRTAEATRASDKLADGKRKKDGIQVKIAQSQHEIEQKIQDRNAVNDRLMSLQQQLTKVSSSSGMSCKPAFGPDGRVSVDADGKPLQNCTPAANVNQVQLNLVKTQIANTQKEFELAQNAVKQSEDDAKLINSKEIDEQLAHADAEFRAAVDASQLYSYAGMLTGKASADVTEADVKRLEKYLIIIPAIAAAFASTLLAVTAVRRIKAPVPPAAATIPDEAANYLFGPLLEAIRAEARDAVAAAIDGKSKAAASSSHNVAA
jgi:hypothetical protein